ncbi:unnamed protein product [Vitrella brassicaformis CCMP3155]|uniref:MORN repeat protein n=2 Tax=Vitrella brassicaformis TaxID=1169539 RepID=A0A0G4EX26_VITBC|nr:unnamed protein product [Vitrella brassicaformis CCMP3155]|eukprot:CEM02639.1 unnamed protein product [Vitrella brassicaformis CCMP3155]
MLQNVIDDLRRSMDSERKTFNKRIEELEAQRDEYKSERDAYKKERDAAMDKLRELEAKMAAEQEAHSNVARTVVHDGGLYHGSIRKVGGTEVPHGTGLLRSLDGERKRYEGEWKDGKYHGRGTEFNQDRVVYEGDWQDGKRQGHGIEHASDGQLIYEGEWTNGERTNKGEGKVGFMQVTDDKGELLGYYHGETLNGQPNGKGELRDGTNRVTYKGEWKSGKRHGQGKECAPCQVLNQERSQYETKMCVVYEGGFVDGKWHGQGKAYYDHLGFGTALWFDGEWREGLINSGTLFPDGTWGGGKMSGGTPLRPITPIRWQAGQGIPGRAGKQIGDLPRWLRDRGVSGYFPAGALG